MKTEIFGGLRVSEAARRLEQGQSVEIHFSWYNKALRDKIYERFRGHQILWRRTPGGVRILITPQRTRPGQH